MRVIKLMWLPDCEALMDLASERAIEGDQISDGLVRQLSDWCEEFGQAFRHWLSDDAPDVHNLGSEVCSRGRELVGAIEEETGITVLFWFDVDRDKNPDHEWQSCPSCGKNLENNRFWPSKNRLWCKTCRLVFPEV